MREMASVAGDAVPDLARFSGMEIFLWMEVAEGRGRGKGGKLQGRVGGGSWVIYVHA